MASEPDDNPFARNSAWPQMPQAPFRVGPLPKAQPAEAGAEPVEAPKTITPAFVRSTAPAAPTGLTTGGAVPRPTPAQPPSQQPLSTPAVALAPVVAVATPPAPEPSVPEPAAPATPPGPYVEIAPIVVQPPGSGARKSVRKSPIPAIAATAAGLAAIFGIAYALSRGQEAALKATPARPAEAAAVAPTASAPAAASPEAAPAQDPSVAPPSARPHAAPRPAARSIAAPRKIDLPPPVAETGVAQPAISLPPPPSRVLIPEPAPLPSYAPPTAPDPNAPVSNQRRD